jgi:hypothetical protein
MVLPAEQAAGVFLSLVHLVLELVAGVVIDHVAAALDALLHLVRVLAGEILSLVRKASDVHHADSFLDRSGRILSARELPSLEHRFDSCQSIAEKTQGVEVRTVRGAR